MKGRITGEYTQTVELNDQPVDVKFSATASMSYQPAQTSGPPEKCYPAESEFDLEELHILDAKDANDKRLTLGLSTMCQLRALINEDLLAEKMWEDFDQACEPSDES